MDFLHIPCVAVNRVRITDCQSEIVGELCLNQVVFRQRGQICRKLGQHIVSLCNIRFKLNGIRGIVLINEGNTQSTCVVLRGNCCDSASCVIKSEIGDRCVGLKCGCLQILDGSVRLGVLICKISCK